MNPVFQQQYEQHEINPNIYWKHFGNKTNRCPKHRVNAFCLDASGKGLYVACRNSIWHLSTDPYTVNKIFSSNHQLLSPSSIVLSKHTGDLFVTDTHENIVYRFQFQKNKHEDETGSGTLTCTQLTAPGTINKPCGLLLHEEKEQEQEKETWLYVCDTKHNQIKKIRIDQMTMNSTVVVVVVVVMDGNTLTPASSSISLRPVQANSLCVHPTQQNVILFSDTANHAIWGFDIQTNQMVSNTPLFQDKSVDIHSIVAVNFSIFVSNRKQCCLHELLFCAESKSYSLTIVAGQDRFISIKTMSARLFRYPTLMVYSQESKVLFILNSYEGYGGIVCVDVHNIPLYAPPCHYHKRKKEQVLSIVTTTSQTQTPKKQKKETREYDDIQNELLPLSATCNSNNLDYTYCYYEHTKTDNPFYMMSMEEFHNKMFELNNFNSQPASSLTLPDNIPRLLSCKPFDSTSTIQHCSPFQNSIINNHQPEPIVSQCPQYRQYRKNETMFLF